MKKNRPISHAFLIILLLLSACAEKSGTAASSTQSSGSAAVAKGPQITLTPTRLPQSGVTRVHGTGFTPLSDAVSHLKKPDGSQFPTLNFFTDEKGEFDHDIESFLLQIGTHEVWVIDTKTGVSSNVAKFETTRDQMPLAK